MPKHTAVYVRVSSAAQDTASQTPDLKRYIDGVEGPVRWYQDKQSGKTMDRPDWNRVESDIRAGKVASVVVWRLDRLGRTASGLTALFELFAERRVNLVSLKDGIDLSTAAGRLMANVLASVASYETEIRSERVRAGQNAARAAGKRWGGSPKGKPKQVSPETAKAIVSMKEQGERIAAIARAVRVSRPTIYAVLRRPEAYAKTPARS